MDTPRVATNQFYRDLHSQRLQFYFTISIFYKGFSYFFLSVPPRYNKVKERSETMTAEEVEKIMRNKISESFQVSILDFLTPFKEFFAFSLNQIK